MKSNILISVVTCFFNEEQFLAEAIESVIRQDYENWELLLVDDGSTDGSRAIALHYAGQYPGKIFYHTHELGANKGVSASRNLAVSKAAGEWIALLDADDIWLPGKLSCQQQIIVQNEEIGMLCEASEYYNWNNPERKLNLTLTVGHDHQGLYYPPQLLEQLYPLGTGAAPVPSGIMFTKKAWEGIKGFEESFTGSYQLYEDQVFLCKMYLKETVYISKKCNHRYRLREGSCVQTVSTNGKYDTVRKHFLQWFSNYVTKENLRTPAVSRLLHEASGAYGSSFKRYLKRGLQRLGKIYKPSTR